MHVQSVVDLFAKQLYNSVERYERAQNHKQTGKITKIRALVRGAIFHKRTSRRARTYLDGPLGYTANVKK